MILNDEEQPFLKNEKYLQVIMLREEEKLTFGQIGKVLGITRERASQMYRRANRFYKLLNKRLAEGGKVSTAVRT